LARCIYLEVMSQYTQFIILPSVFAVHDRLLRAVNAFMLQCHNSESKQHSIKATSCLVWHLRRPQQLKPLAEHNQIKLVMGAREG
ncbi:hypothetical protein KCV06_g122, partial [Aureobasidium melanogenum]